MQLFDWGSNGFIMEKIQRLQKEQHGATIAICRQNPLRVTGRIKKRFHNHTINLSQKTHNTQHTTCIESIDRMPFQGCLPSSGKMHHCKLQSFRVSASITPTTRWRTPGLRPRWDGKQRSWGKLMEARTISMTQYNWRFDDLKV